MSDAPLSREVATLPAALHEHTLVVHGEQDDTVPLAAVMDWARPQTLPVTVVPGGGHQRVLGDGVPALCQYDRPPGGDARLDLGVVAAVGGGDLQAELVTIPDVRFDLCA